MIARLAAGLLFVLVVVNAVPGLRRRLDAAISRVGTSSAPSVGIYDAAASALFGGLYRDIAAETLRAVADVERPEVLEIGPGPGHLAEVLLGARDDVRWAGLDVDRGMLSAASRRLAAAGVRERANLVEGDVAGMPFRDATFDLVVTSFSAHHWSDPEAAFREIRRVLRPGGRALCYDLPAWWGRVEGGSRGLDAADAAFESLGWSSLRSFGPIAVVRRLELGVPKQVS